MKKRIIALAVCVLTFIVSSFALIACGDCGGSENPDDDHNGKEVTIVLNHSAINIQEGGQALLVPTVTNFYGDVALTSSDETIASVDLRGVVMGISCGSTVITATAGDKTATCTVTVTEGEEQEPVVEALAVLTLLTKPASVANNYEFDVKAELSFNGKALDNVSFNFYVTNATVAEISNGTFIAKATGRTDLVVSCEYNGKVYSDRCNIQII